MTPLLNNPNAEWDHYAITQILRPADKRLAEPVMGCSIRTQRWRYTEWADGKHGVELYDHHSDPMEFHNLAENPDEQSKATMRRLRPLLRKHATGKIPKTPFNPKRL